MTPILRPKRGVFLPKPGVTQLLGLTSGRELLIAPSDLLRKA